MADAICGEKGKDRNLFLDIWDRARMPTIFSTLSDVNASTI